MPGLGTTLGRGGATTAQQDLANADAILIMGSSMAENHPVGFQWVIEARERGATVIHVDPRFTRTSAMADLWVPLRAGSRHRLPRRPDPLRPRARHGVPRLRRAATRTRRCCCKDELRDAEDLDGLFSGWDDEDGKYDPESWLYRGATAKRPGGEATGHEAEKGGHGKDGGGDG